MNFYEYVRGTIGWEIAFLTGIFLGGYLLSIDQEAIGSMMILSGVISGVYAQYIRSANYES